MARSSDSTPPDHLSERAAGFWRDIVGTYRLESHHLELLRRLCEAMDVADQAREVTAKEGFTITDRYGQTKPHPCVNIERDARVAVARLIRELDLDAEGPAPETPRPPRKGAVA